MTGVPLSLSPRPLRPISAPSERSSPSQPAQVRPLDEAKGAPAARSLLVAAPAPATPPRKEPVSGAPRRPDAAQKAPALYARPQPTRARAARAVAPPVPPAQPAKPRRNNTTARRSTARASSDRTAEARQLLAAVPPANNSLRLVFRWIEQNAVRLDAALCDALLARCCELRRGDRVRAVFEAAERQRLPLPLPTFERGLRALARDGFPLPVQGQLERMQRCGILLTPEHVTAVLAAAQAAPRAQTRQLVHSLHTMAEGAGLALRAEHYEASLRLLAGDEGTTRALLARMEAAGMPVNAAHLEAIVEPGLQGSAEAAAAWLESFVREWGWLAPAPLYRRTVQRLIEQGLLGEAALCLHRWLEWAADRPAHAASGLDTVVRLSAALMEVKHNAEAQSLLEHARAMFPAQDLEQPQVAWLGPAIEAQRVRLAALAPARASRQPRPAEEPEAST